MNLIELQKIVIKGEGLFVEFKHKINFPEKIARELVAFANTRGGKLFVGIDDNRTIFGLKNPDEEVFALHQLVKQYIKFPLSYSVEKINVHPKKAVVSITIDEGFNKPNFAFENSEKRFGTAYVRVADKTLKASAEMLKILKLKTSKTQTFITYGELEKSVLQIIDKNKFITVNGLQQDQLLSYETASGLLVNMTIAGILEIIPEEDKEDKFVMNY